MEPTEETLPGFLLRCLLFPQRGEWRHCSLVFAVGSGLRSSQLDVVEAGSQHSLKNRTWTSEMRQKQQWKYSISILKLRRHPTYCFIVYSKEKVLETDKGPLRYLLREPWTFNIITFPLFSYDAKKRVDYAGFKISTTSFEKCACLFDFKE